jgi:hypothetical protein
MLIARVYAARGELELAISSLTSAARQTRRFDRLAGARLDLERARLLSLQEMHSRAAAIANSIYRFTSANGALVLANEAEVLLTNVG